MGMHIRQMRVDDRERALVLWERSARATHHFLEERDIVALRPLVAEELATDAVDWWLAVSDADDLIGFLGYANDTIEGLFIDPDWHGKGAGTLLVAHAQSLSASALKVDVNEPNERALGFYESLGFSVIGRSPTDSGGRPFPLLHMKREIGYSASLGNSRIR